MCFPFAPFSFAFGPFLLPGSFVVSLLCLFLLFFLRLLLPFHFISSSSLCLRFLCSSSSCLVSCFPFFSLLLLVLSFGCHVSLSPLPSSVPLLPSSVFFCFSSPLFLLFLPFLLPLFSPIVRSYYFLLCLFFSSSFFFWFFSYFFPLSFPPLSPVSSFPSVIISCLFLSLAYSSSFTPFFSSSSLFFFSLGLVSLSVISCSFF